MALEIQPLQNQATAAPLLQTVPSTTWRMLSSPSSPPKLPKGLDEAWAAAVARAQNSVPRRARYLKRAAGILAHEKHFSEMAQAKLRETLLAMRDLFRLGRQTPHDVEQAFAAIREAAAREVGMRPYLEQVAGALAMEAGCIAELATGEGKTLSATMPATIAGWRGRGCHVITVNDYLAKRDAQEMGKIYKFCGLSTAWVEQEMRAPERREAYLCDITYCTNKEASADFLRDRLSLGNLHGLPAALLAKIADGQGRGPDRMVMRGLDTAIVDEADSVLIDEAVTPLIIAGDGPNVEQVEAFKTAAELAVTLERNADYKLDFRYREVRLTGSGEGKLEVLGKDAGGVFAGARRREELVTQAILARDMYTLGKQYVVQGEKIVIVDEFTGRLMPDRTWRDGLHQAVEAKEKIKVNPPKVTLARVSFQRFFRLYKKLSGMTGTAWEARHELWQIYKLPVVRIPTHKPCIRKQQADRIFGGAQEKWAAVVEEIKSVHEAGRPVLVGTRSVQASEHLSGLLAEIGLDHQVLNAVRHAEEAAIIAAAGQGPRITVATNMAGRGTDIKLGRGIPELGGLHVIATERHESGRIDRQLFGRAGRQGDPGSAVAFVSVDDELIRRYAPKWMARLTTPSQKGPASTPLHRRVFMTAQRKAQRQAWQQRRSVLKSDDWLDEYLGFAGRET